MLYYVYVLLVIVVVVYVVDVTEDLMDSSHKYSAVALKVVDAANNPQTSSS